jgi:imidazolonepropionase-like amidohydrolase
MCFMTLPRRGTRHLTFGLLLTAAACGAPPQDLVITGVSVIDVADGRVISDSIVTVAGDTIVSVTQARKAPAATTVVDGEGAFLIPGLWDMHAHTEAAGESSLPLYVANGITAIRDMGSALDLILRLRAATATGDVLGPRIFAAGPILDDAPAEWPFRMRVAMPEEGRAAVQLLHQRGVDLIKVHDRTPRDVYFAIAEEARRLNLPLAGHVPRDVTVEEAIDAGQRGIEHLSNHALWRRCSEGEEYRPEPCRPFFEMLARRDIWQTPTLAALSELATIGTPASSLDPDQVAYASRALRETWAGNQSTFDAAGAASYFRATAAVGAVAVSDMAAAGVGILAGCDATIAGFCIHDELEVLVRGGMTPLAALQAATVNPARFFGLEVTSGRVAPGHRADLVLLEGNPLTDIDSVRRIRAVVLGGRVLDRQELDRVLADVRRAAAQ